MDRAAFCQSFDLGIEHSNDEWWSDNNIFVIRSVEDAVICIGSKIQG
jgi:hypothetical protein